ncbi:hypothetical protein O6H91_06G001400 [Diphasiastrum complanatum]|uniref:Uncharacterized protein n=1 Tax=Diphasiastrum complanatum TaxID=34168 RepID=A0ACC2DA26_DIPCM|nr:hypothetical protein O6H91_06G001400 [Diphasiastrum complanatum]
MFGTSCTKSHGEANMINFQRSSVGTGKTQSVKEVACVLSDVLRTRHTDLEIHLNKHGAILTPQIAVSVLKNLMDVKLALRFFNWASRQVDFKHTTYTYNCLLKLLVKAHCHQQTFEYYDRMLLEDCSPNSYTFCFILSSLCHEGKFDEAHKLLLEMERKGLSTHHICI